MKMVGFVTLTSHCLMYGNASAKASHLANAPKCACRAALASVLQRMLWMWEA